MNDRITDYSKQPSAVHCGFLSAWDCCWCMKLVFGRVLRPVNCHWSDVRFKEMNSAMTTVLAIRTEETQGRRREEP